MRGKSINTRLLLFLIGTLFCLISQAQIPDDLSKFKAAMITEAQLRQFVEQAAKAGMNEAEIEDQVRRRGLPEGEIQLLRGRIRMILATQSGSGAGNGEQTSRGALPQSATPAAINVPAEQRVFGAELFNNSNISFEPDLRIPTPANYQLGPDDQLVIDVFGVNQTQQAPTVTPEGYIKLNYIGPVYVNGLTVEEARNRIIAKLAQVYPAIRSGGTKVQISLGAIRTIKVTLLGAVKKPGTYSLPSVASLFNALYSSGGPDQFGSFRSIELIRNNKVVEKVDIYRFLLNGDQSQNLRLQDQDVIRIPVAKTKVQVIGEVKRQGIFELLPGETLGKLINDYNGGFQKTAYTANIRSERITDREKQLIDISKENINSFLPQDGDVFTVDRILDRYANAVSISGAVFRPGKYSLREGMKISDLLARADGLKEDVYTERALLYRLKEDQSKEVVAINLTDVLRDGSSNIMLRKDDHLIVSSVFELKDEYPVTIAGAVRKPATYTYRGGMSLKDLILQAGGLTDEASLGNIQVSRRKTTVDPNDPTASLSDVSIFSMDTIGLSVDQQDFRLQPFDIVSVKTNPFKRPLEQVVIEGQVLYPGPYTLLERQERLSSLLARAGSTLVEANISGASLRRLKRDVAVDKGAIGKMAEQAKDSTGILTAAVDESYDFIALDLASALADPGGNSDIFLQDGDVITIPRKDEMVNIEGEVLHPVKINYEPGKKMRHYINAAGGFVGSANKNKLFVVYANGKAARTKKFLFIRDYPELEPGAQVYVPKYVPDEKPKRSPAETLALVSGISAIAYVVVAIVQALK